MSAPMLYIFSGLPAVGKTTLARGLAQATGAALLRIDTVEQGLRDLCNFDVEGEGYRLSYRIVADNLALGNSVVADSCNTIELTRREWEGVATDAGASFINIEVICSDSAEHRRRVESRDSDIDGLYLSNWQQVKDRVYDTWSRERVVVDTAGRTAGESMNCLLRSLEEPANS